jgi:lipopolysaccharide heptosyltransferase II
MKFLVISLAGIGDTLFAGPLIHELRLNFPEAEIEAAVMWPGAADILAGNPHLNAVHQKNLIRARKTEALGFLWELRRRGYDMTINSIPQSRVDYRLVARVIGAPVRISHDYDHLRILSGALVNRTLPPDYSRHCVENNLALLKLAGAEPRLPRHEYELYLSESDRARAEEFVLGERLEGMTLFGIHVGSGGTKNLALRRWPLPRYFQLIRQVLDSRRGVVVLLFGGPEEEKDHRQLLAEVDRKRVFAPQTRNLRQAAALLGKCSLFLSVDTALMHLAAAMKVPGQIVIETPTWNKTVEPYNRPFTLVRNPAVAGRNLEFYRYDGRGIRGTPEQIIKSMESVTVAEVARAVKQVTERMAE